MSNACNNFIMAPDKGKGPGFKKGCGCKRSGCLKNYCECYQARVYCSAYCKCIGCGNNQESTVPSNEEILVKNSVAAGVKHEPENNVEQNEEVAIIVAGSSPTSVIDGTATQNRINQSLPKKCMGNLVTVDFIAAVTQCMVTQAVECQKMSLSDHHSKQLILEESARCLEMVYPIEEDGSETTNEKNVESAQCAHQ